MDIMSRIITSFSLIVLSVLPALSEIKKPVEPVVKDVFIINGSEDHKFRVEVVFGNGEIKRGNILLPDKKIIFQRVNRKDGNRTERISAIKSVKFLKWMKKNIKDNIFLFSPVSSIIILKNNSKIYYNKNIKIFNRIDFYTDGNKKRKYKIYSIFYDYWYNNRWEISKSRNINYPETNPNDRSVVEIKFLQRNTLFKNFLQTFE